MIYSNKKLQDFRLPSLISEWFSADYKNYKMLIRVGKTPEAETS